MRREDLEYSETFCNGFCQKFVFAPNFGKIMLNVQIIIKINTDIDHNEILFVLCNSKVFARLLST